MCHGLVLLHPLRGFGRLQPLARNLASADIGTIPDIDRRDRQQQSREAPFIVMSGASFQIPSGAALTRSLSRVTTSIRASAAGSSSLKYSKGLASPYFIEPVCSGWGARAIRIARVRAAR